MDIRPLRYFVTVAELGSFSAAARHLNVAQTALSRHVAALESELTTQLFVRTPRGVSMTEPGERLLHYGLNILRQLELVPNVVHGPERQVMGRVSVGLPSSVSAIFSAPLLVRATRLLPGVRVHLTESLSGYLEEWVQCNRLDVAILFNAVPSPNVLLSNMLVEDLCLLGPIDAFPKRASSVEFHQLQRYPLVLPGMLHSLRRLLENMARSHGIRLNVAYEVDSQTVTRDLLHTGGLFGIVSQGALHEEVAAGRLRALRIVAPAVSRSVALAMCALPGRTPACEQIGKLMLDLARELQASGVWKASPHFTAE